MEYEKILTQIGGFGRAQLMVFLSLSMTSVKAVLDLQLLALMLHVSPFRCAQQNSSGYEPQGFDSHCTISRSSEAGNASSADPSLYSAGNMTEEACTEFEFENDFIRLTMVKDFQLVCARDIYPTILMSVYFFGDACGMLFATLGDRIGRRTILLVCGCVDIVTTVLPVFTPTVEWQIGARFLKGLASPVYYQGLLLVEELTAAKHRAMLGNLYWLLWCIGYSLCSLIAYLGQEWRIIQLISLAFSSSYILVYFLVPESPRWLLLKGRTKEAGRVFEKMARWNGIRWRTNKFDKIVIEETPTGRTLELFTYPIMRRKTLIIVFVMLVYSLAYYGLTIDTTFIIDDVYINTAVSGVLEIPAYLLAWQVSERIGRRTPTVAMSIVAGVAIIAVPFIPQEQQYLFAIKVAMALIGKCLLTAAYSAMDIYGAENFPTSLRNNGVFLSAVVAGFLSVISPVINYLSTVAEWLPAVVFGGLTIVSVLSVLWLPETKDMPLPDTVEDAEKFVRGNELNWRAEHEERERQVVDNFTEPEDLAASEMRRPRYGSIGVENGSGNEQQFPSV
ncbi:hypothetical protein BOX15_Mlig008926g2 [Macrostomum lignano]|uniref:MFS domain-containing protein n=2 Tax=Macrostomum lignano TaxID=282301 RepID=A0A1I8FU44_9PLAT|nr:hypothetical protein BOX15_Mlig008926g2 [Macrostomum lignano]